MRTRGETPQGEKMEDLGGGLRVYTAPGRTFGIDSLLLADFAQCGNPARACDLGTGCGILPLLLSRKTPRLLIDAVEINPAAADAARRSAAFCGLAARVTVFSGDYLDRVRIPLPAGAYGLVISNPPFFADGTGKVSASEPERTARHETRANFSRLAARAAELLQNGGRFCFCHRPERLPSLFTALNENRLVPKRLRFVQHDVLHPPFLLLCEARKNVRPGMSTAPVLLLHTNAGPAPGGISMELSRIYGPYIPKAAGPQICADFQSRENAGPSVF